MRGGNHYVIWICFLCFGVKKQACAQGTVYLWFSGELGAWIYDLNCYNLSALPLGYGCPLLCCGLALELMCLRHIRSYWYLSSCTVHANSTASWFCRAWRVMMMRRSQQLARQKVQRSSFDHMLCFPNSIEGVTMTAKERSTTTEVELPLYIR